MQKQAIEDTPKVSSMARLLFVLVSGITIAAQAETVDMPEPGNDLVGKIQYATARQEDTLIDIARRYSVGQDEMVMANPTVDRWLPKAGTKLILPREYILPDAPRAGIVVNIPEMRMYYYPVKFAPKKKPAPAKPAKPGDPVAAAKAQPVAEVTGEALTKAGELITYPISIGRMDWNTPLGKTYIASKVKDPVWIPPESIKREHAKDGDILPNVVPAGPDNPLGQFAMKLGVAGYLIHGTDRGKSDGIGMRVTHGCVRMYPEDIEKLFPKVAVGTPVYLVNQSVKVGWKDDTLYMEVHQPLDEDTLSASQLRNMAKEEIRKKTANRPVRIDEEVIRKATAKPSGLPVVIGRVGGGGYSAGSGDSESTTPAATPDYYYGRRNAAPADETYAPPPVKPSTNSSRYQDPYGQDEAPVNPASRYPYGAGSASRKSSPDQGEPLYPDNSYKSPRTSQPARTYGYEEDPYAAESPKPSSRPASRSGTDNGYEPAPESEQTGYEPYDAYERNPEQ